MQDSLLYSRAYWVSRSQVAWTVDAEDGSCYLYASKTACLSVTSDGIQGLDTTFMGGFLCSFLGKIIIYTWSFYASRLWRENQAWSRQHWALRKCITLFILQHIMFYIYYLLKFYCGLLWQCPIFVSFSRYTIRFEKMLELTLFFLHSILYVLIPGHWKISSYTRL